MRWRERCEEGGLGSLARLWGVCGAVADDDYDDALGGRGGKSMHRQWMRGSIDLDWIDLIELGVCVRAHSQAPSPIAV